MNYLSTFLAFLTFLTFLSSPILADPTPPTPAALSFPDETTDQWRGYTRHKFQVEGRAAWVVEPKTALPGKPWAW